MIKAAMNYLYSEHLSSSLYLEHEKALIVLHTEHSGGLLKSNDYCR